MEDELIIGLYFSRSEAAITETEKKYGGYLLKIAMNILQSREDSEECVSDTYLKVWNVIPPERPLKFLPFLGKITRNLSIDRYDKGKAKKRGGGEAALIFDELEDCIRAGSNIEKEYEDGLVAESISDFLRNQKEENRIVFVRRYWYADSVFSISERYGMSESKVKTILFRTRNKLKIHLEKEGMM
ncbi:MAG: sigma-70 family RNA polymerase sigma factor [Oscillospiraceae bacterium]|nr:sigma-70 family RNA polymerase sigma factor [Oscillospiraceae bacterium]